MKFGGTGTQKGMSVRQKLWFVYHVHELVMMAFNANDTILDFHHGDCVGFDDEAHDLIREFFPMVKIIGHPGIDHSGKSPKRAYKTCDELREPKYYTDRNKDIVNEANILIAAPRHDRELIRSGTWQTIRYAQKLERHLIRLQR